VAKKTKHDVEHLKVKVSALKFKEICDVIKAFVKNGTFVTLIICIFLSLKQIISSDINKIQFSIDLLRAFKISEILGIAGTCIFGVAWSVQLCRNRRLVKKGGDQRHQIEHNDPYNKRSGLDSYGVAKEDKGV
jgi:hypothetical protein